MDVKNVLSKMTIEEKAQLVSGVTFFRTAQIEDLGIFRIQFLDGGTGINFEQLFGDFTDVEQLDISSTNGMVGSTLLKNVIEHYYEPDCLTDKEKDLYEWIKVRLENTELKKLYAPGCYPPGILLGATWNREVVRGVGEALGKEACVYGVDVLLGTPNVNIHRDPLGGRLFEGYSEDPYLVSALAPQLVQGVQEYGVAANVKHFAANNQETNRVGINETISLRALEEIYFPGFKACVQDSNVRTVMSAYNRINGVACTENQWLLTEKLREEWGFNGVVVSDWGAVYHPAKAMAAGNDLAMPGPVAWEVLVEAIKSGELCENDLNLAAERMLMLLHEIESNRSKRVHDDIEVNRLYKETDEVAYKAACEGIVLLENAGILPFSEKTKVCIVGSGKDKLLECGTGSAGITTNRTTHIKDNLNIVSMDEAEYIICICSLGGMEGNDRPDMMLSKEDLQVLSECGAYGKGDQRKYKPVILILNVAGPIDLSLLNRDVVQAVLLAFLPGMQGGRAISDILLGRVNPSGKLPITFPKRYEDTPTYINFPGDGYEVTYGEGIYVGYRYYDKKKISPGYPFGYGLSYTNFACSGIGKCVLSKEEVTCSVSVKNIGKVPGAEVVQIYVSDPSSTLDKPLKELKEFQKIYLMPGEEKTICFRIPLKNLSSYDADIKSWTLEEGWYEILAATSSLQSDIFAKWRFYLDCDSPYRYGLDSTVKVFYEKQELKEALKSFWDANDWDWGIVESNYEYTSNRTIASIMPAAKNDDFHEKMKMFINAIQMVKKD